MAYYAFFSLFPLLLTLVVGGSFFLESEQVYRQVVEFVAQAFPISPDVIESNLRQVLELRGPVGFAGLIALAWSASGVFTIVVRNINLAWQEARPRSVVQERLAGFGIVAVLTVLLVLAFVSSTVFNMLAHFQIPLWEGVSIYQTPVWTLVSDLAPRMVTLLVFFGLYRVVPNTEVRWTEAILGAVVATLAWEAAAAVFSWYLSSGWARYEFIYGSLGTVVSLLLWIYISAWIALFGAYLSAAIARDARGMGAEPQ